MNRSPRRAARSLRLLAFTAALLACIATLPAGAQLQEPAEPVKAEQGGFLQLTWLDLAFTNHYPVPNTRFADFSDYNLGGEIRLNFMPLGIKPLWLSANFMADWNKTNSKRLDSIVDLAASLGAGWRFPLVDRFYFTPRISYGFMLHWTYGDYYNDPSIYPGDPRAGKKDTHFFSDTYFQYEAEFAYDISPSDRHYESEVFLAPSFIHFAEKHRQGLEAGYLLGVRMKFHPSDVRVSAPARFSILAGKVIDEETGETLADAVPLVERGHATKTAISDGETFAWNVTPDTEYFLKAEKEGYDPLIHEVPGKTLLPDKRTIVVLAMKRTKVWGVYGHVFDKDSNAPLKGVDIAITDSADKKQKTSTDKNGDFRWELRAETDYELVLRKKDYFTISSDFSTKGKKPGWYDVKNFMRTEFQKAVIGATVEFGNILFDSGSADIRPESTPVLDKMVRFLRDNPKILVELGAHTDSMGDAESNLTLSQARAQSAMEYMIAKGIPASRITAMGYGETKLKNRCADGVDCTPEEHQENRRTELRVKDILPE
ncbi:MAG: hypothetical protein EPN93_06300 [Spirochaetes bacterium]|nr:MAG: hypothetical protein EPN93_06300 [Spirochaetota bacterium]